MKTTVIYRQMVHPHSVLSSFGVGANIIAGEEPLQVFVITVEPGDDPDVTAAAVEKAKRVAQDENISYQDAKLGAQKRTRALDVG